MAAVGAYKVFPDNNIALPIFGAFFSVPCFRWIISGTKGELELTSPPGIMSFPPEFKVRIRRSNADSEEVVFGGEEPEHISSLPAPAANVGGVWEAFHQGNGERALSIREAVKVHELLEKISRLFPTPRAEDYSLLAPGRKN